nr:MAG TPA: holin [Bacteriophage sp.]
MFDWKSYVLPQLLALVPFLIGLTEVVKTWLFSEDALVRKAEGREGKARRIAYRILPSKNHIPLFVWTLAVVLSASYGFMAPTYQGWRTVAYSLVMVGLVQGSIVGFAAMGVFDAVLKKRT